MKCDNGNGLTNNNAFYTDCDVIRKQSKGDT